VDALAASERRIAELAADGLTNRQIAQTLFITARTVESHLASVFRKLGIESREKLRTALWHPAAGCPPHRCKRI
jgi:DNA-binding CsgD family transcriptional regulator